MQEGTPTMSVLPGLLPFEVLYPKDCFGPLDDWLRERVLVTLPLLEAKPDVCLNQAMPEGALRAGAYRMVANEEVSFTRLVRPAAQAVGEAVAQGEAGERPLCVHDRTELDFSHLAMEGLGEIGNPDCRGLFLQTSLCVDSEEAAFGVLHAKTWVRPPKQHGKAQLRKVRPFDEKESRYWWDGITEAEARVGRPGLLLHLIDAEGDILELFARAEAADVQLLVRAAQNRRVAEGGLLYDVTAGWPVASTRTLHLPARGPAPGQQAKPARDAQVEVRFGSVTLLPPQGRAGEGVQVWCVRVREPAPPEGVEGVDWVLLTNLPVLSEEGAWGVTLTYVSRWRIEEFHKALKTGCRVERRQHKEREHLENLLALLLQTAVRLLRMRTLSRTHPDTPADTLLSEEEIAVLREERDAWRWQVDSTPRPTLAQVLPLIAFMGGYMGRRSDKPFGWLTLWRGYEALQQQVIGYRKALSRASPPAQRV